MSISSNINSTKKAKPFVKWVGGKRQLISELLSKKPARFNRYFEPFVGAGALFFELECDNSVIVDLNKDLINTYEVIRDSVDQLIDLLHYHQEYNCERHFYKVRGLPTRKTNSLGIEEDQLFNVDELDRIERAARFIYLNRTCYNGLYRINSKGQFNVPFGNYKKPKICDEENLYIISEILAQVEIYTGDFTLVDENYVIGDGDFVYFDPPYVPLNETSNFTAYTEDGFNKKDQERLSQLYRKIDAQGGLCMLSNSETDFVRELYEGYNIKEVAATRAINCKGKGRGEITELIITNY